MGATGLPLIYSAVLLALCVSYIQGTYSFVIPVHTFISFDIESSNRNNFGKKNVNGNKFWHFGSNQNVQSKNNFDEFLTGSHSPSRPTQRWTEGNKKKIFSTNRIAVGEKKRRMSSSFDKRNGKFDRNKWSNYRQLFLFVWRKLANYND